MRNQSSFDELSDIFSSERLEVGYLRRLKHQEANKATAVQAYSVNIKLSQALYPALQILEVGLRNSLNNVMSDFIESENWFEGAFLSVKEIRAVEKAKRNLTEKRKQITTGRMVAELPFGFWTSLFDSRYEHQQILWPKLLKQVFPYMPRGRRTRNYVSKELNKIRALRNRVFHYEPIWHWRDLLLQHTSIVEMTKAISLTASDYLKSFDQFQEIYVAGKSNLLSQRNQVEKPVLN